MKRWVVLIALLPTPAMAEITAQRLEQSCQTFKQDAGDFQLKTNKGVEAGVCIGYLHASIEFISIMSALTRATNLAAAQCPPDNLEVIQFQRIFLKWIEENPEKLSENASVALALASGEAFPCPAK